jgi:hypothetical protein
MADIGVEQNAGSAAHGADLGDAGERRDDGFEAAQLRIGKAARLARRPGRQVHRAVGEMERRSKIVRRVFGQQLLQIRKVERAVGVGEPAPHRAAGRRHMRERVLAECRGVEELVGRLADDHLGARPSQKPAAHDLRMQGAHEHRHPPQGQVALDEALAHFAHHLMRLCRRASAVDEPGDDRPGVAIDYRHCGAHRRIIAAR